METKVFAEPKELGNQEESDLDKMRREQKLAYNSMSPFQTAREIGKYEE